VAQPEVGLIVRFNPATTHFEARDVGVPYGAFVAQAFEAVIDRVGESRTNDEVTAGLAARLGFAAGPDEPFDPTPERMLAISLPGGMPDGVATQAPGTAVQFRDIWPGPRHLKARLVADESAVARGVARVPEFAGLDSALPLTLISPANARTINSIFGDTAGPSPEVTFKLRLLDNLRDKDVVTDIDALAPLAVS
jgi:hypothetical protein